MWMDVKKHCVKGWSGLCLFPYFTEFLHEGNEIIYLEDCIQIFNKKP